MGRLHPGNETTVTLHVKVDKTPPTVTRVLVASSDWTSDFLTSLGGVGYAIPDGPNQLSPLPGSNLNKVIIEFSEDVDVAQGDLALTGVNVLNYAFSAFSYDATAHRATWTLSQNLALDKLLIGLDGSTTDAVADAAGNRLDGKWTNPTPAGADSWPSKDGTPGGNFLFRFNVLPGDANQSGVTDATDLNTVLSHYNQTSTNGSTGDFNGDGTTNATDLTTVLSSYNQSIPVSEPVEPALLMAEQPSVDPAPVVADVVADEIGNPTSPVSPGSLVGPADQAGPAVSSVTIVEQYTPRDGVLTPNEGLVITFNAVDPDGVATATLSIDGIDVTGVGGPYATTSGVNFGALLGTRSAGTHNYSIVANDNLGNPTSPAYTGSFNVTAALVVDASAVPQGLALSLTDQQLAPMVAEAQRRLAMLGDMQLMAAMASVNIQIADLPGGLLGEAMGKTILIDRDAAGYGWFIDSTPGDDLEFASLSGPHSLAADSNSLAARRVDLLTTVMHEMGHVLGYEHSDSLDLMYPTLSLGTKRSLSEELAFSIGGQDSDIARDDRLVNPSVLDQVFASFQNNGKRKWSMA